ncbi:hypothetical protein RUMGNA_01983 [Mediterraneibacter gnavus ATCC 29149]|uniref:Uncharacterized protein n=1 Tax=Mediterraneibacter gnavus (strain ATCC 29149 / DSM 114966 / JCM 6515 / VPI C7-9) TaxID=411470 RepID=A7B354_MEDG7|nr:hypothetical protein RUMGNA_01983 [Mediterraneibacter gnavus ATCC 29149]
MSIICNISLPPVAVLSLFSQFLRMYQRIHKISGK